MKRQLVPSLPGIGRFPPDAKLDLNQKTAAAQEIAIAWASDAEPETVEIHGFRAPTKRTTKRKRKRKSTPKPKRF